MEDNIPFVIRSRQPSDYNFIVDSYWRSRCDSERPSHKKSLHRKCVASINMMILRGAEFRVAHFTEDQDAVLGWGLVEGPILHYVYVKVPYRRQGIATRLIFGENKSHLIWCSHWSVAATAISIDHPGVIFYTGIEPPKGMEMDIDEKIASL